jgi:hypothetical protein
MNIRYQDLDRIIVGLERGRELRVSKGKVGYVKGMMARSRHKRLCPPVFPLKSE